MRFERVSAATLIVTLVAVANPRTVLAQDAPPSTTISGEIRFRGEWDARTPHTRDDAAVLARTRVGIASRLKPWLSSFVELQDSRAWGTEADPSDASADALDLHQAYLDVGTGPWTLRAGRQELGLGDQRLVGVSNWGNTARSFDGLLAKRALDKGSVSAFWMNVAERDDVTPGGLSAPLNEGLDADGWLLGGFATRPVGRATAEGIVVYNRRAVTDESWTAEARLHGSTGEATAPTRFLYDASGAYQFGPHRQAHFFSGMLGVGFTEGARIAAQLDYLSGDSNPGDADRHAFSYLYPSAHPLHGSMDYFTSFPAHTASAGMVDAVLRLQAPTRHGWSVRGDVHSMQTAIALAGERSLGTELDLSAARPLGQGVSLEGGASAFRSGPAMAFAQAPFAAEQHATTSWAYLMFTVSW
jgi:hypothetical protein